MLKQDGLIQTLPYRTLHLLPFGAMITYHNTNLEMPKERKALPILEVMPVL